MHSAKDLARSRYTLKVIVTIVILATAAGAQDRKSKPTVQADEVVRVSTALVQTDVTVLNKQGRFVDGLNSEQFELIVDGRPQAISFFEQVPAQGSSSNRKTADKPSLGSNSQSATSTSAPVKSTDGGRIIFFFVDDVHLAPENLIRARKALLSFVDNQMRENDRVAIVSTSGQVGFLQQLTENRSVLREAVARLSDKRNLEVNAGKVPISEYDAGQISEHFNRELFNYLVAATAAEFQSDPVTAAAMVVNRVHQIGFNSRTATRNTMGALLGLMRSSAVLPGRKIVFFMTDGFVADPLASNVMEMLKQVTRTAAQVGAVIYAMDARGTFSDPGVDASQNRYPDFTGSMSRNLLGESTATQEPLQILAADTGGRAIINSNSFLDGFARALDESSSYYLLAWRPEREAQRDGKSRIIVRVKDRPDLKVRVRRGFLEAPARFANTHRSNEPKSPASPSPDEQLRTALGSLYPVRDLPLALSVGYLKSVKDGTVLTASMEIDAPGVGLIPLAAGGKAQLDVLGVAIDDRGAIASFKQKLSIDVEAKSGNRPVVWNQQLSLAPGLYQVRVAVRERESGLAGSAMQWLEVPDLSKSLALSTLYLGERNPAETTASTRGWNPRSVMVDVDHRFGIESVLRFQTYIYNADRGGVPDVEIQARVLRNDNPVLVLPVAQAPTRNPIDYARLPYWAEIALEKLEAGRYVLQVVATDKRAKATATQHVGFIVD